MIITQVCGGLGNQMFQYAMGRALSLQRNVPLLLDVSWFAAMGGATPRQFQLPVFPALEQGRGLWRKATQEDVLALTTPPLWRRIAAKVLCCPQLRRASVLHEEHMTAGQPIPSPSVYLVGYWQNESYFDNFCAAIRSDFSFPALPDRAQGLADQIASQPNAVSVHVRRGDYASNPQTQAVHGLCSLQYYERALKSISGSSENVHCFIFSDDPQWVRENFNTHGLPATIVDAHDEDACHHDMHLMSLCRHHIIANSSFSWWGAWLAREGGITIAPRQWFADPALASKDPCPQRWVRI